PDVDDDDPVAVAVPGADHAPLVGGRSPGAVTVVDRRAAGQEGVCLRRPPLKASAGRGTLALQTVGYRSKAPMAGTASPFPSPSRGRSPPRWSVAGAPVLSPRSMAGLPASRACVLVGPPLLASSPSCGSSGSLKAPI